MPKSMKLLLRISSILILVLSSCATNNVVKDYKAVPLEKSSLEVTYFSDPTIDYVYKANITAYGHELTGIFIAKKINSTAHRVVFTTEFGNKLLDFEISGRFDHRILRIHRRPTYLGFRRKNPSHHTLRHFKSKIYGHVADFGTTWPETGVQNAFVVLIFR